MNKNSLKFILEKLFKKTFSKFFFTKSCKVLKTLRERCAIVVLKQRTKAFGMLTENNTNMRNNNKLEWCKLI